MENVMLFACVSAAVVLTNGFMLFTVALYVTRALKAASKEELNRLEKIQSNGTETLSKLLAKANRMRTPFDSEGGGLA